MKQELSPITIISISFIALIIVGTVLLSLPWSTVNTISLLDALFTSTSAVCVTGLIVLDTATDFTRTGQAIILLLIQLGGLGIMTLSMALILFISSSLSVRWQFALMDLYGKRKKLPIRQILPNIIIFTLITEALISLLLMPVFLQDYPPATALWYSIFHAISSFCNAGFSTFSNSISGYSGDWYMISVLSISIITGGLGFLVLSDIAHYRHLHFSRAFRHYSLHTKVVLVTSSLLIVGGALFFYVSERSNLLRTMPFSRQLCISFFQSVSCRTAGFNSVPLSMLRDNTLFFMILLMVTGGSPGSIAGGIKTTTLWVLGAILISRLRKQEQLIFWNRAISSDTVERSTTLFILATLFIIAVTVLLSSSHTLADSNNFIDILFESASAFGTVGLSSGVTGQLTSSGKIIIICTMFIGRIGPLTFLTLLSSTHNKSKIRYPRENLLIG